MTKVFESRSFTILGHSFYYWTSIAYTTTNGLQNVLEARANHGTTIIVIIKLIINSIYKRKWQF